MMEAFLWKEWWLRDWVLRRNSFRSMSQARNWHYWTSNPYANKMSDSLWCRIEDMDLLRKKSQLEEGRTETHSSNQFDQWKWLNGKKLSSSKTLPSFLSMTFYEISVYFCKFVCVYIEHPLHSTAQDIHSLFLIANLSSVYITLKILCICISQRLCAQMTVGIMYLRETVCTNVYSLGLMWVSVLVYICVS